MGDIHESTETQEIIHQPAKQPNTGRIIQKLQKTKKKKTNGVGVHFVYSTECNDYFDYQAAALDASFRRLYAAAGLGDASKGITRLLSCSQEARPAYEARGRLDFVPTHVHDSFDRYGNATDFYPAYNKPGAMYSFTQYHHVYDAAMAPGTSAPAPKHRVKRGGARESMDDVEYLVYLDADMVLESLIDAAALLATEKEHTTVAGLYSYLVGVSNGLADDFDVPADAQPYMKQVGGWMIASKDDMLRVAPHWLEMTRRVRNCESKACGTTDKSRFTVWEKTGDKYITPEQPKPWISEMYGYVFGSGTNFVLSIRVLKNDHDDAYCTLRCVSFVALRSRFRSLSIYLYRVLIDSLCACLGAHDDIHMNIYTSLHSDRETKSCDKWRTHGISWLRSDVCAKYLALRDLDVHMRVRRRGPKAVRERRRRMQERYEADVQVRQALGEE